MMRVIPAPEPDGFDEDVRKSGLRAVDCTARAEYAEEYWHAGITFDYLKRHAPFVGNELHRQNRLRAADV